MKGGKVGGMAMVGEILQAHVHWKGTNNMMNELWDAISFWIHRHRHRRSVRALKLLECDTMRFCDWPCLLVPLWMVTTSMI